MSSVAVLRRFGRARGAGGALATERSRFGRVRGFAGATDLGDQQVALVLDVPALLEELLGTPELTALEASR